MRVLHFAPNLRGAITYAPGHFYSPLLDIRDFGPNDIHLPFDGPDFWEHIDLRPTQQQSYYEELVEKFYVLPFPKQKTSTYRYFANNKWFHPSDAFTLSGIIQKEKPKHIVEVGSGFSSAVMLDTLSHTQSATTLTLIDPYPDRLHSLLSTEDKLRSTILASRVQDVSLDVFEQLEAGDVLFIDSSHVAKVGSDVTFLFLRILPRLKPGVLIHIHDVFYPFSYPAIWIRTGWAWNESIFLRAFLIGNPQFQILAFNSYAAQAFPDVFRKRLPEFLDNSGCSIWIKKVASTN